MVERWMLGVRRGLVAFLQVVIVGSMAVMTVAVVYQVFARYCLHNPSKYTEEIATLLMIWVGSFGAALGFERGSHLGVDILMHTLNPTCQRLMRCLTLLLVFVFAIAIWCMGGWAIMMEAFDAHNTLKTLPFISRGWAYLPLPLSGVCVVVFVLDQMRQELCHG